MKLIFSVLILFSVSSFAQKKESTALILDGNKQVVKTAKTYGYIDGVRMDSIDARYAEFSHRLLRSGLIFAYGQSEENRKKMLITDRDGKHLAFVPDNISMLLNFFDFNGWELAHVYNSKEGGVDTFILKRK